jgi:hypothetical protein
MATSDQVLGCSQGDTFNFAVTLQPNQDSTLPDLTGATAAWVLLDGNYQGAEILLGKRSPDVVVNKDDSNNWQVVVGLDPVDTQDIPPGNYYHQCKVVLPGGAGSYHIEGGPFALAFGTFYSVT